MQADEASQDAMDEEDREAKEIDSPQRDDEKDVALGARSKGEEGDAADDEQREP